MEAQDKMNKSRASQVYTIEENHRKSHLDGGGLGIRHVFAVMSFSALCTFYMNRNNINIAIVAMVGTNTSEDTVSDDVCPRPATGNRTGGNTKGEFNWNEETQGFILGSFFYGYVAGNILGGLAAEYFGGRNLIAACSVVTSLLSIASPVCARTSVGLFIAARVLSGIAQGSLYPGTFSIMSSWIPPNEKASFGGFIFVGNHFGTVISTALGGVLASSDIMGGWPSVFYIFGIIGLCWTVLWIILVRDQPENHPFISKNELRYISDNISKVKSTQKLKVPWRDIWTSVPFLCLLVFSFCDGIGFYTLLTETPSYLSNIQHFDLESNGFLSALPYLCIIIVSPIMGCVFDLLLRKQIISLKYSRKISTAIGMFGPGLSLIAMCFVDCNSVLAVVGLCFAVGLDSGKYCGALMSEQDISPNYSGVLKGIVNAVSAVAGIVAPLLVGTITQDNETLSAWREVFGISAVTYFVGGLTYIIFGSVKVQRWNEPREKNMDKRKYEKY